MGGLFLLLAGAFLAAFLTGRVSRDYEALPPDAVVTSAGEELSVQELAERHVPRLFLRPETSSPPLLGIWYEAVPVAEGIDLVYHFNWENEVNPNAGINPLYALFRAAYFGYPLRDIEYFQVEVDMERGLVERLRFETSRSVDYEQVIVEHIVLEAEREEGNVFRVERRTKEGEMVGAGREELLFEGGHVLAGVVTWNHMCALLDAGNRAAFSKAQRAELEALGEDDYRAFKFARKSQGDHGTREGIWSLALALGIFLGLVLLGVSLFRMISIRSRRKDSA